MVCSNALLSPFSCRYNTQEVALTSYGDSEAESEDDDDDDEVGTALEDEDDFENLDSVSVVAARNSSNRSVVTTFKSVSSVSSTASGPASASAANATGAATEDSGRGESPESCSSASGGKLHQQQHHQVVIRRVVGGGGKSQHPRPISAVPSEYSDISTSSYRSTTSEADEDESGSSASASVSQNIKQLQRPPSAQIQQQPLQSPAASPELVSKHGVCATASNASTVLISEKDDRPAKMERVYRVASELLSTEEQYVAILHLIDQVSEQSKEQPSSGIER